MNGDRLMSAIDTMFWLQGKGVDTSAEIATIAHWAMSDEGEHVSLRDEIEKAIEDAIADTGEQIPMLGDASDRVIRVIRNALVSDEAVEAASLSIYGPDDPYHILPGTYRTREHLTAALDAVTGEQP
jgi:hypothetical protein